MSVAGEELDADLQHADGGLGGADALQVLTDGTIGFGTEVLGCEELFEITVTDVSVALGGDVILLRPCMVRDPEQGVDDRLVGGKVATISGVHLLVLRDHLVGLLSVQQCFQVEGREGRTLEAATGGSLGQGGGEAIVAAFGGEIRERNHRPGVAGKSFGDQLKLFLVLVFKIQAVEQHQPLDMREGGLFIDGDTLVGHGQGDLGFAEQDLEAGLLSVEGIFGRATKERCLGFKEADRFLGLTPVEKGFCFE